MSRPFHVGAKTTQGRGVKVELPNDKVVTLSGPEKSSMMLLEGPVMT